MEKKEKPTQRLSLLFLFVAGVVALWCTSWGLINLYIEHANRGQFGDQFGAVNSLFSGLTLAGLVYTIYLQRLEIKEILEANMRAREEMEIQNKTSSLQRFENSFFNILSQHNEFVGGFSVKPNGKTDILQGRNVVSEALKDLDEIIVDCLRDFIFKEIPTGLDNINLNYRDLDARYNGLLDAYFNSLYKIFEYVKQKGENIDQDFYNGIIKSQLTVKEKQLMAIYGLTKKGEVFKEIMDDNHLLVSIPDTDHGLISLLSSWRPFYKNISPMVL